MSFRPKNVLVTGGAGFIGSHYIDLLLKDETIQLINLDALTYAGKIANLHQAQSNPRYRFIHGNICDKPLLENLFAQYNIDTVVHFAAETHVDRSILGPEIFIQTNILGTQCLLEAARIYWQEKNRWDQQQCRFHMISTDEVFGSLGLSEPAFTELSRYQPNSPYAASKAAADHLVCAYFQTYALPITLSNCANNYGARQDEEKLIPKVIQACLRQQPIPVYGNGRNRRDWIYVLDHCNMVDWVVRAGKIGESYNLGAHCERENIEIISIICGIFDELRPLAKSHRQLIQFVTDRPGHDLRYAINAAKALAEGCIKPRHNLEHVLQQMIMDQIT